MAASMLFAGAGFAAPPDLQTLTECSDRAWEADIGGWANYAFDRHVTRRSLDKSGEESFHQELHFRVTPADQGFDEKLVEVDGRQPTPKEAREHREKARFTKHYAQAENLELDNPIGENLALVPIIQNQDYRLVGEERVNGIPCHRVVFDAATEPGRGGVREQLLHAVKGSACFSVEGCHLVTFEMETVRTLKEGPIKLEFLKLSFKGQAVEHGWILESIELQSDLALFGKRIRKYNSYRYSDFRRQPE
jgi:hypothetical protein